MVALTSPRFPDPPPPGRLSTMGLQLLIPFAMLFLVLESIVLWVGGYHYESNSMTYGRFWSARTGLYRDWLLAPCEGLVAFAGIVVVLSFVPALSLHLPPWLVATIIVVGGIILSLSAAERSRNHVQRRKHNFPQT